MHELRVLEVRVMRSTRIAIWRRLLLRAVFFIFFIAQAQSNAALAADSDGIAGVWWTPEHDGKVAISLDATGVASGRLIAVSPEDANSVDDKNADSALRMRPVLGLTILKGFSLDTDGRLAGGTIYDPDSGKTYYGTLTLGPDGKLVMRASYAFNLLWRTEVLQRVDGDAPGTPQPGEPDLAYLAP